MPIPTFSEYVAMREGVRSPNRPPFKGMSRINALSTTDAHRKRLHTKPPRKPTQFAPTVRKVKEIVPQKFVAKLKPLSDRGP